MQSKIVPDRIIYSFPVIYIKKEERWSPTHRPNKTLDKTPDKTEKENDKACRHGPEKDNDRSGSAVLRILELGQIIPEAAENLFAPQHADKEYGYLYKITESDKHASLRIWPFLILRLS